MECIYATEYEAVVRGKYRPIGFETVQRHEVIR